MILALKGTMDSALFLGCLFVCFLFVVLCVFVCFVRGCWGRELPMTEVLVSTIIQFVFVCLFVGAGP